MHYMAGSASGQDESNSLPIRSTSKVESMHEQCNRFLAFLVVLLVNAP